MLIRKPADIRSSEVTPKNEYLNRRRFLAAGGAAVGALAFSADADAAKLNGVTKSSYTVNEKITPMDDITTLQQLLRIRHRQRGSSALRQHLTPSPWQVQVGGMVDKPKTYDLDEIMKIAPAGRAHLPHRCVEAWSMVIPWIGFPLAALLKEVEPNAKAKYVAFQTLFDQKQMPLESAPASNCRMWKAAAGRSHASAGAAGRRTLWRDTAEPERRADPPGGAVEVRLQEDQVDREDHAHR